MGEAWVWDLHKSWQGLLFGALFGVFATGFLWLTPRRDASPLCSSALLLNLLVTPWVVAPSLLVLTHSLPFPFQVHIPELWYSGEGLAWGFFVNIASSTLLLSAAISMIIQTFQGCGETPKGADKYTVIVLWCCAACLGVSGCQPWRTGSAPFLWFSLSMIAALLVAGVLVRKVGIDKGLLLSMGWTALELGWMAGSSLAGLELGWMALEQAQGTAGFYLSQSPWMRGGIGPLMLELTAVLLAVVSAALFAQTRRRRKLNEAPLLEERNSLPVSLPSVSG